MSEPIIEGEWAEGVIVGGFYFSRHQQKFIAAAVKAKEFFDQEDAKKSAEDARAEEAAAIMRGGYFNSVDMSNPEWEEATETEKKRWRDSARAILAAIGDGLV